MQSTATDTVIKESICHMCGGNCPIKVYVENGRATRVEMMNNNTTNTCPRWKAILDFVYHPDRLLQPLKRTGQRGDGNFTPVSWDEALDITAAALQKVKEQYGPESVVFYVSFPKEPRPYYQRLAYSFGSPNYCTESSNCATAVMLANSMNFGPGGMGGGPRGINPAAKCQLIWGSNVRQSAPQQWNDYTQAKKNGLKIIAVDPRRTATAYISDIHLQLRPGTDGALALGLMNVIINERLYDKEFVEKWTVGFDELNELVQEYTPEKVEQITQVPADKIKEAAIMYATNKPTQLRHSICSIVHCTNGVQNQRAIALLPAITGNVPVPQQGNGAPSSPQLNDVSLKERRADLPPGFGADVFPLWTGMTGEMQSNVLRDYIDKERSYPLKAIFGAGLNTTFFPNTDRFMESFKKLDFIVVTDYFHTTAARNADIVLPISSWLERPTLLGAQFGGNVRLIEPVIEPLGETWPEWQIIAELAKRLGLGDYFWDGDFEKCMNYILEPLNITLDDLRNGAKRPEPKTISQPLPQQKKQAGFKTPSGKVEIASSILAENGHQALPVYQEPAESPLSQPDLARSYPLVLTTGGRTVAYVHSQFRNIQRLRKMVPEPELEINPADADERGIETGDDIVVTSPRGKVNLKARVTDTILAGVVHAPHHWPDNANINILADDGTLDPISGFGPFKSQLCQVAKL